LSKYQYFKQWVRKVYIGKIKEKMFTIICMCSQRQELGQTVPKQVK